MANAVYSAFYYLCPGSRHLYTKAFRRILYLQIAQLLTGLDVCPTTVQVLRAQLFPDEILEDEGDGEQSDGLPPLPHAQAEKPGSPDPSLAAPSMDVGEDDDGGRSGSGGGGVRAGRKGKGGGPSRSASAPLLGTKGRPAGQQDARDNDATAALFENNPNPVSSYTGGRSTLRFRPTQPAELARALPRQGKEAFNASKVSPLLQQYLEHGSSTCGRRPEVMKRTTPVSWCRTGGSETFRRTSGRKEVHESISNQHAVAAAAFKKEAAEERKKLRRDLNSIERESRKVTKGGAVAIGRYALDLTSKHR